jgi:hypothetical protein
VTKGKSNFGFVDEGWLAMERNFEEVLQVGRRLVEQKVRGRGSYHRLVVASAVAGRSWSIVAAAVAAAVVGVVVSVGIAVGHTDPGRVAL